MEQALVIGAGGGLGQAMVRRWTQDPRFDAVWCVSRSSLAAGEAPPASLHLQLTDHSDAAIEEQARNVLEGCPKLSRVVISLGTLHGTLHGTLRGTHVGNLDNTLLGAHNSKPHGSVHEAMDGAAASVDYAPEKSLDALNSAVMQEVHRVNCVLPLLWLSALARGLRRNEDCRIAILSARVGSIGDNGLGGWYSYRSAKAALNMGLRCAAIELARRARGTKLIAYHPGTVDTALSKPFQRGVPEGKLFTPDFAAQCLDGVLDAQPPDGELSYLDWAGQQIPW